MRNGEFGMGNGKWGIIRQGIGNGVWEKENGEWDIEE